ncbi:MAG: glycosyltransferase family 2 protein [Bacteroidales bacterium]|nr:glycosyltransferase family 2 protein [Bacteroidales bacterium]
MALLSVVIITLNEERNIGRCLQSVGVIADEVVVVDSGSTDRTEAICLEHGARFISHTWLGFAETKNFANSQAKYPLILSLDADEALSEKLKASILAVKAMDSLKTAFSMNRLTNYCGKWVKHCGWYPDTKTRLFSREYARWTGKVIHEKLTTDPGVEIKHLEGDLLHYSYYSIAGHIAQANRFTDLTAEQAFREGKKSGILQILIKPPVKFIRDYFFKLGFLDGYYGFIICRISAQATFFKYIKLRQLNAGAISNKFK